METVAVIDVGSNTLKVLVARGMPLEAVYEAYLDVRIGAGLNREPPVFDEAAMAAGAAGVVELQAQAKAHGAGRIVVTATSAVRDSLNGLEFAACVRHTTGLDVRVLSGEEEALAIGRGVAQDPALAGIRSFQVADLGGGSLELLAVEDGVVRQALSLPLGAVRLTERLVPGAHGVLPAGALDPVVAFVDARLRDSGFAFVQGAPLVCTGGVGRHALACLGAMGIPSDSDPAVLTVVAAGSLRDALCSLDFHGRRAKAHLSSNRADIMPVALEVLLATARAANVDRLRTSGYNLRWGIAAGMLGTT